MEQYHFSGFGSLFRRIIGDRQQPSISDTAVFAVRLIVDTIASAREIAVSKRQGISERVVR